MNDDERPPGSEVPADEREALLSVAHGAVVTSGGVSVQRLLSILIEAVLTRGLGPELYGVYAFGWRLVRMVLRFATLGADRTLLRDVASFEGEPDRQRRTVGLGYATTAVTASVVALGIAGTSGWINDVTLGHPVFPPALRIFAVLLVLLAFVRLQTAVLRAAKAATGEVVLKRVLRPGVRLVGAAVAMALGYSVVGVVGVLVVANAVLVVAAYPVVTAVTGIRPMFQGHRSEARHFYDHAVPSALSRIGGLLRTRVDVLLVGILLTTTAAGVYNVVLVLVGIVAIPLFGFNQLLPSVASDLYTREKMGTLNDIYRTVTRLVVTATLPFVAVLVVFGPQLLGVFGSEYVRGYPILLVFLVGRFVGNAVGGTGLLLSMTNHQYAHMGLEWVLAILNVVLTYLFVVEFGLIGAALGTSLAITVQNLIQVAMLRQFEGLWPFDLTFAKPMVAGAGMCLVMVGVSAWVDGPLAVGLGPVAGLVAFVAALRALGIDRRDRLIARELADRYRAAAARGLDAVR